MPVLHRQNLERPAKLAENHLGSLLRLVVPQLQQASCVDLQVLLAAASVGACDCAQLLVQSHGLYHTSLQGASSRHRGHHASPMPPLMPYQTTLQCYGKAGSRADSVTG